MDRIFVRLPDPSMRLDILQSSFGFDGQKPVAAFLQTQPDVLVTEADDEERARILSLGGIIYEDVKFELFNDDPVEGPPGLTHSIATEVNPLHLSLRDVVEQIDAPAAWNTTRGAGVTIVIIDTGVSSVLRELRPARRSGLDLRTQYQGQHWQDPLGHGSMCAAIAAGSVSDGGRYDGVAPEAVVLSVRSSLMSRDLTLIYDELIVAKAGGSLPGPLVISNSYGVRACKPLGMLPADHPFLTGVTTAIDNGIFVCFAAGNNHHDCLCNFDPRACSPDTVWGPNSHDKVFSVGSVNRALTNRDPLTPHVNSSRGPGEWAVATTKPDCVAPTYGEVPWGSGYRRMPWWGTSGACPQVAGAAALVLSVAPHLDPAAVGDIIRHSCRPLTDGPTCVGHGVLDCGQAVALAMGS